MAPLQSLEREHPMIDANFRDFCASHGIFSTEDFLLQDIYVLTALAALQKEADRLKEGIVEMLSIIENQCQPWLNGMELLEDASHKSILSTGDDRIDSLLNGGFRKGQLTELVGPSSSGKTQICMKAATNVAEKHMGGVLYLDTGNSFSPLRIACFISLPSSNAPYDQATHKHAQKVMSRISCHPVFDIFAMFDVLQHLEHDLRSQKNIQEDRVRLLIIDSISSLITPILGGHGSQGRALMVATGYLLKKLAHEYNLSILVTNHMVGGEGGSSKPALGETWKSIPHVRLQLNRDHRSNLCSISILKHTSLPYGKSTEFML